MPTRRGDPRARCRLPVREDRLDTTTPDGHFVIDHHPRHANVLLASPCSDHGFKHAFAVGEALAEVALDGRTRHRIDLFSLR